jgi:hypothetical protein
MNDKVWGRKNGGIQGLINGPTVTADEPTDGTDTTEP